MPKIKNPQIFLDISIDRDKAERITFELFANVVPKTAENFRALCTGERGLGASTKKPLYFKGTNLHRIIPGFVAQGGDFSKGDGRGGESIYGGKFRDENFKLKHDKPGVLSMANSGSDSNGSQFFITFKPTPHLDGKHVVFGKVVNGVDLLKKLEAVGSEGGVPSCQVKIVDCGEVSDINTQDKVQVGKEKKHKRADVNSDDEQRAQTKNISKDKDTKRSKKRKHYSSDSYSSDTSDSQSYSSDSISESESYSSSSVDTSSSSDHRHKRRKGSKKDKRKPTRRKGKHAKSKRKTRGSKRKSRRSYGSSSDDSKSSKTDSSGSDSESAGHRTKRSLPKGQENTKTSYSEQVKAFEDVDRVKEPIATGNKPHDENEADDGNDLGASSRISLIQVDENLTKPGKADGNSGTDAAGADTVKNLASSEPVTTNGKGSTVGAADNGQPHRIRKGRGFTKEYAFARRYRTPSPERFPVQSSYDGGRNDRWNNFNRYGRNGPYGRRSPVRRYRGSPGAISPSRYSRRDRSRGRSRSPVRRYDRGGYRRPSPRRSRSPTEQPRRDLSDRPRSGRGAGGSNRRSSSPFANRGRLRSRSKSRDPSRSRSPDPAPPKRESSKYNRRRSSSSRSSSPDDGNKGLVSY